MKRWHGHNLQVSVWELTAIGHGGMAAITSDKSVVVSQMSRSYALHERCSSSAGGLLASTGGSEGAAVRAARLVAGYGKDHRGAAMGGRVRGRGMEVFVCVSAGRGEQRAGRMGRGRITAERSIVGIQGSN